MERLAHEGLRQILRRRSKLAGLKREPTLHDFRRQFALSMLNNGVDIFSLQRLMGRSDISILRQYLARTTVTASRINSRNSSIFWESERNADFVQSFLQRKREVDGDSRPELLSWLDKFERDKREAALEFWYDIHKGIHESLREF